MTEGTTALRAIKRSLPSGWATAIVDVVRAPSSAGTSWARFALAPDQPNDETAKDLVTSLNALSDEVADGSQVPTREWVDDENAPITGHWSFSEVTLGTPKPDPASLPDEAYDGDTDAPGLF